MAALSIISQSYNRIEGTVIWRRHHNSSGALSFLLYTKLFSWSSGFLVRKQKSFSSGSLYLSLKIPYIFLIIWFRLIWENSPNILSLPLTIQTLMKFNADYLLNTCCLFPTRSHPHRARSLYGFSGTIVFITTVNLLPISIFFFCYLSSGARISIHSCCCLF